VPEDDERRLAPEALISSMRETRGKPFRDAGYVENGGQTNLFSASGSEKVFGKNFHSFWQVPGNSYV
jgi:hypothetical protein